MMQIIEQVIEYQGNYYKLCNESIASDQVAIVKQLKIGTPVKVYTNIEQPKVTTIGEIPNKIGGKRDAMSCEHNYQDIVLTCYPAKHVSRCTKCGAEKPGFNNFEVPKVRSTTLA